MPRNIKKNTPPSPKKVEPKKEVTKKKTVKKKVEPPLSPSAQYSRSLMYIFPVLIGMYFFVSFFLDKLSNKPAIRAYCQETETFIQENASTFPHLFTTWFDEAKNCQGDSTCQEEVQSRIMTSLDGKESLPYFESTYFIRAKSNTEIEKLFLSGEWKMITVTKDERKVQKVLALLQGRHRKICDQGFKTDGLYPNIESMTYLHDIWSEAEIIIPVKEDGKVIGAVVKAWGD